MSRNGHFCGGSEVAGGPLERSPELGWKDKCLYVSVFFVKIVQLPVDD